MVERDTDAWRYKRKYRNDIKRDSASEKGDERSNITSNAVQT